MNVKNAFAENALKKLKHVETVNPAFKYIIKLQNMCEISSRILNASYTFVTEKLVVGKKVSLPITRLSLASVKNDK